MAHNDLQFHIPIPLANVLNGGLHAGMNLDFQEFMLAPNAQNLKEYPEQLETIAECYQHLKRIISAMNQPTTVGDEGGFAPKLRTNRGALKLLTEAIKLADFTYKDHIYISLDIAANSFFHQGQYQVKDFDHPLSPTEYTAYIDNLVAEYDPLSIEDPFHEDDWSAWATFTNKHDQKCMIVGDDILVTHKDRLKRAIKEHTCNTILLKPNQVGTLSEAIEVATLAKAHHFYTIASHRSGETTDTFIADFAVGLGTDFTKFGAPARGERVAKYNRLLEIYREISH